MRYSLKLKDWLKGLILAVGTPVLYVVQELIPNWPLSPIEKAAISAFITYLIKNFFTDDIKAAEKTLASNKIRPSAPKDEQLRNE